MPHNQNEAFFHIFFIHILSFPLSLGLIQPYLGIYLYDFTYIEIVLTCGPIIVVIHHLLPTVDSLSAAFSPGVLSAAVCVCAELDPCRLQI